MANWTFRRMSMTAGLVLVVGAALQFLVGAAGLQQAGASMLTPTGPGKRQPDQANRRNRTHGRRLIDEIATPDSNGDRLSPGQSIEIVDNSYDPPSFVVDPTRNVLSNLADNDFIAIIRVESVDTTLSADGTWVNTVVSARIVENLRSDRPAARDHPDGSLLRFDWLGGGEVAVDGHRITAATTGLAQVRRARDYVVFASPIEGVLSILPHGLHELSGGRLKSLLRSLPADRLTDGQLLSEARKAAKTAERRRR